MKFPSTRAILILNTLLIITQKVCSTRLIRGARTKTGMSSKKNDSRKLMYMPKSKKKNFDPPKEGSSTAESFVDNDNGCRRLARRINRMMKKSDDYSDYPTGEEALTMPVIPEDCKEDILLLDAAPGFQATFETPEDMPLVIDAIGREEHSNPVLQSFSQGFHGSVEANSENTTLTYTPEPHYAGEDQFDFVVSHDDGEDTTICFVLVANVNDPPEAIHDFYGTFVNTPLVVDAPGVLVNDKDFDGDALIVIFHSQPKHGTVDVDYFGGFRYTPNQSYIGNDQFSYVADDGNNGDSNANVTIVVHPLPNLETPVFDPPETVYNNISHVFNTSSDCINNLTKCVHLYNDSATHPESYIKREKGP